MIEFRLPRRSALYTATVAAALVVAACAGASSSWTKANVTPEAMAADKDECRFFGQAAALSATKQANDTYVGVSSTGQLTKTQLPGAGAMGFMEQSAAYDKCMVARGYTRTPSQ